MRLLQRFHSFPLRRGYTVVSIVILLAFGVFSTAPITAEIVIYDFTGTVTSVAGDSCGVAPPVDAPVEGTVQWDTEAPDLVPGEQEGEYSQPSSGAEYSGHVAAYLLRGNNS